MAVEMKIDGNLVRNMREARAWSQEHLAALSGLSTRTVQRLEKDGTASLETRLAVAGAFDVEAESLGVGLNLEAIKHPAEPIEIKQDKRIDISKILGLGIFLLMLLLVASYKIGKDLAIRDNYSCKLDATISGE